MQKPIHIVFTTIFVPHVLRDLVANLRQFGHLENCKVWLVADRKTPPEAQVMSEEAVREGLETVCLSIDEQDRWGRRCVPDFYERIPYNNETRRNIGYLRALEDGCEILISIDDDNFPTTDDFVGRHAKAGTVCSGGHLQEESGFHNLCEYLTISPPRRIYPRGFPFNLRGATNDAREVPSERGARIGAIAGLWLQEPDVDATTWLNGKVAAIDYTGPELATLSQDTWTPINTQNTSVIRELICGYLCIPMGHDVPGGKIQRYGDIWGGYFLQAIMGGTDYHVAFGRPLVDHRRNPHNYVDDLRQEFWGMILTDWLIHLLRNEFRPSGAEIDSRVRQLAEFLREKGLPQLPEWAPEALRKFLMATADNLTAWASACQKLG